MSLLPYNAQERGREIFRHACVLLPQESRHQYQHLGRLVSCKLTRKRYFGSGKLPRWQDGVCGMVEEQIHNHEGGGDRA